MMKCRKNLKNFRKSFLYNEFSGDSKKNIFYYRILIKIISLSLTLNTNKLVVMCIQNISAYYVFSYAVL